MQEKTNNDRVEIRPQELETSSFHHHQHFIVHLHFSKTRLSLLSAL